MNISPDASMFVGGIASPSCLLLAASEPPTDVRWALAMLGTLVALLGVFLLIVALLAVLRRRHRQGGSQPKRSQERRVDPWAESARRLNVKSERDRDDD